MKKLSVLILTAIFTASLLAGCSKSSSSDASKEANSLKRVQQAGKLVVGLDDSYPPMEFRDESNNLVGFDIDLGNEIGKKLGVKVEFTTTDWNGILLSLTSKKFDVILSSISITDERKKTIDFSNSYIDGGQVMIVKSNNSSIKDSSSLKNKIIACQLGSTGEEAASKIQGTKEVKKYDKITEALHDLSIGRVDVVVADAQVGGYYTQKQSGEFKILDERLTKEPIGLGLRKSDKDLTAAINKALDDLKADGTLSKLSTKWFGYDIYKN